MSQQHKEIREGDEFYCVVCEKRWDVNDPYAPKCLTKTEINQRRGKRWINKIRKEVLKR